MPETSDDRRYRVQVEQKQRIAAMEAETAEKAAEYNNAMQSGEVSPELEKQLKIEEAERNMDRSMSRANKMSGGKMKKNKREDYALGSIVKAGLKLASKGKKAAEKTKDKVSSVAGTNFDDAVTKTGEKSKGLLTRKDGSAFAHMGDDVIRVASNQSQYKGAAKMAVAVFGGKAAYDKLTEKEQSAFESAFSDAHNAGEETFEFEGKAYSTEVKKGKMAGGMLNDPMKVKYSEGGRLSVSEYVKARDTALKNIDNAESITAREKIAEDFSKISKKFMEQESLGNSLDRERKEKAEALKKKNMGGMMKYNEGGSMLMPPEMEQDMPVDTYDNIPEDEKEAVEASQLPDAEMEEDYAGFVLEKSLDTEDQEYLMSVLETDERLSSIFDKVMDVAGEFAGEGAVEGPGNGTSDSIPARLSDGEFVFTKKATDQMGADQLQTMMDEAEKAYDGGYMKKAFGGMVDDVPMDERQEDEEINSMMIASNQMPSVRPR